MRSPYAFLFVTGLIFTAAVPTTAQARCWDTGHSLRCAPGCVPTKLPRFPGDSFSWRCRRQAPPPPRYYAPPPPRQPSDDGCGPGMYPATPTWCCEIGSVFRNGRCVFPDRPPTYEASGPTDPTVPLGILGLIVLAAMAWYDHQTRQIAYARETADSLDEADDIAATARRMEEAAAEADDILRRFRDSMNGDDA